MGPPGRRKRGWSALVCLLCLLFFTSPVSAASGVLGIDFGTEYIKAAIAKPGSPLEIVLTKDSKRKETAALAFKPSQSQVNDDAAFPERLYGGDALALAARYPTDVYMNLKSILGLPPTDSPVKQYLARYSGLQDIPVSRGDEASAGATVGFKSQSFGKDGTFMVEELVAMQLKNIKANAEASMGKDSRVDDVVITFPSYYTAEEKRALELAAELAGLRVLGLVSDGLAVGLNYATHRTIDSTAAGSQAENHVVFDMGAGSTTATVLRIQGRTVKGPGKRNTTFQEVQVIGTGSDRTLGGDSLNDVIVTNMIEQLLETPRMKQLEVPSISILKHGKTMNRLYKDAERMRQILSANQLASATFEGLFYEDVNFKYSLTREDFEAMAQSFSNRIATPLTDALAVAGLTLADVESVILHGGMIRTPFVQKQLEKAAGGPSKIKTNVNADEAAALGAAFKAASISPAYRVKDIRGTDMAESAYTLSWTTEGKVREQKIFIPTSQVGVEKQVTVKCLQDTALQFKREGASGLSNVLNVEMANLTKSANELKDKYGCAANNITTVFTVRLRPLDGIPELVSGTVSCVSDKSSGSVMDNVKGMFGFGSKKEQQPLQEHDGDSQATPLPVSDPTSSGTTVSSATVTDQSSSAAATASTASAAKPKSSVITIPLASTTTVQGLNQPPAANLPAINKRLSAFDTSDRSSILRAEALNMLETYTYRARDYLTEDWFAEVSTESIRTQLQNQLSAVSDWLYGDGIDAKLVDFQEKLKQLRAFVDPALKRREEHGKRDTAVQKLKDGLDNAASMIEMVKSQVDQAASDAAASLASTASSATEAAASAVSAATAGGDDLEDDPYATSGSTDATSEDATKSQPKPYQYSEEDLLALAKAYDTAKLWLDEKLAAQAKLKPFEDPAVLVADLQSKTLQLQNSVTSLIMKQIKKTESARSKKAKTTKKAKTKKEKSASSTTTSAADSAATAKTNTRDEL